VIGDGARDRGAATDATPIIVPNTFWQAADLEA
jgi:hypothetical protein